MIGVHYFDWSSYSWLFQPVARRGMTAIGKGMSTVRPNSAVYQYPSQGGAEKSHLYSQTTSTSDLIYNTVIFLQANI
jgi:hypothetical protein